MKIKLHHYFDLNLGQNNVNEFKNKIAFCKTKFLSQDCLYGKRIFEVCIFKE